LKKHFYVVLMKAVASSAEMEPFVEKHLLYMLDIQNQGKLFASGPFFQEDVKVADGLAIFQTDTVEETRALIEAEPLTRRGLRNFEIRPWELREGRMTLTLNSSTSSYDFSHPAVIK
jgi:uncharacterized protein YciI